MSLAALARGLRQAGGVLSPDVAKTIASEDSEMRNQDRQETLLKLRHTLEQEALKASPQHQMQQEALKNEKLFREEVSGAGGDLTKIAGAAVKYGKPELAVRIHEGAEQRAARLQQAAEANASQVRSLEMRLEDKALNRESQERLQAALLSIKEQGLKQAAEAARANRELKILGLEMQRDRAGADKSRVVDRQVTAFANDLQQNKLPGLASSMTNANELLKKYEDTDIPGIGTFVGSKKIPEFMRSEEANNMRSALVAVTNDLLNLYSGLAVTLPEAERRELEEMRGGKFSDKDFKNAWPRIVNRYNSVVGNLKASGSPEVIKEYQSRPGAMKLDDITPAFSQKNDGGGLELDGYRFPNKEALDAYKKAKAK
jgi:hypothetical protein